MSIELFSPEDYSPAEIAIREQMRKEPVTFDFLSLLFSSRSFKIALNASTNRMKQLDAEGGFVVYKRIGSHSFTINQKFGTTAASRLSLHDSSQELKDHHLSARKFVRVGDFYMHASPLLFSGNNFEDYEERVLEKEDAETVPVAHEAFKLKGYTSRVLEGNQYVDLFGFSLPQSGLVSTEYQSLVGDENLYTQERDLRSSGFRVANVRVPFMHGRVALSPEIVEQLALLGG